MSTKKLRLLLISLLLLSIGLFIFLCVSGVSTLKQKSQAMVDLKVKNKVAEAQLTNLEKAKKEIDKYSFFKDVANTVIPNDKDQAQAVLDITQMASSSGIGLQSVTFPSSNLGLRADTGTADSSAGAGTTSTKAISQAKPVKDIPGLYSLELTATRQTILLPAGAGVTYPMLVSFLQKIENNRRTAQISQINITPIPDSNGDLSDQINFVITINIFIKP